MTIRHHLLDAGSDAIPLTISRGAGTCAVVVIVPSAFGIGPDLEAQMEELAQDASLVVAFDPFFRGDAGLVPYDGMKRVLERLQVLDRTRAYDDLCATLSWARAQAEGKPVLVLGICFGGPFALLAAADGVVDGIVTWHGTRMENYLVRANEMACPMRLHFGGADPIVPMSAVETVRSTFATRDDVHLFVYEGAGHGFSHRASSPSYDARAERAALDSLRSLATEVAR